MQDEIYAAYKAKCGKYKTEDLTEELKAVLLEETVNEQKIMDYINAGA